MLLDEFVGAVLPAGGNYFVEHNRNGIHRRSKPLSTLSDLIREVNLRVQQGADVWVATGAFGNRRSLDQVLSKKAFYADVDCGPGKPYPDKKTAVLAIASSLKANTLPVPTLLVDSGNGIHLWWVLDAEISKTEWLGTANNLKRALKLAGIHTDAGITADAARIMRVPGTFNLKDKTHPKPTRVLGGVRATFTHAALSSALDALTKPALATSGGAPTPHAAAVVADTNAALGEGTSRGWFAELPPIDRMQAVVEMLQKVPGADDYTTWIKIGGALAWCDREYGDPSGKAMWRTIWIGWAKTAPNFDRAACLAKWNSGQLPVDRLTVGSLIHLARENGYIRTGAVKPDIGCPEGGYAVEKYGTVRREYDSEGKRETEVIVLKAHIVDAELTHDPEQGFILEGRMFVVDAARERKFTISSKILASDQELKFALSVQLGIQSANPNHLKEIKFFMQAFMDMLERRRDSNATAKQLGWNSDDSPTFALGKKLFHANRGPTSGVSIDHALATVFEPKGHLTDWQHTVQTVIDQGRQEVNAIIASAFAAPLMRFTGVSGSILSLESPESGTGKSTALRAAQSVWGNPQTGINALDDTPNSVIKRLEMLNHLPAYWDELRMKEEVSKFVKFVFQLAQGKGKSRLHSTATLQNVGTWETLITCATNEALRGHIEAATGESTDAGHMRLFEMRCPPLDAVGPHNVRMLEISRIGRNYGRAGEVYAQWLVDHMDEAKHMVQQVSAALSKALNPLDKERFWFATVVALIAGAKLAEKAGVLRFDIAALARCLIKHYSVQRYTYSSFKTNDQADDVLGRFATANSDLILRTDIVAKLTGNKVAIAPVMDMQAKPRSLNIIGQLATRDRKLIISAKHFEVWVYQNLGISGTNVAKMLLESGIFRKDKYTLGRGTLYSLSVKLPCYVVDMDHPAASNIFE